MVGLLSSPPDDWWPDGGVIVMGKHGQYELAFVVSKESYLNDSYKVGIEQSLKALRACLWQAQCLTSEQYTEFYNMKTGNQNGTSQ